MSDLSKDKVAFAVGLLAVLFTITPLLAEFGSLGFAFLGARLTLQLLYYVLSGLLALSVYFYAIQFAFARPQRALTITGDALYAAAVATPVLFVLLWGAASAASVVGTLLQSPAVTSVVTGLLGLLAGSASTFLASKTRTALAERQAEAEERLLTERSVVQLRRAEELFAAGHFDLSVVEAYRAVESAARRRTPIRSALEPKNLPQRVLQRLPTEQARIAFDEFRRLRNVAAHAAEPITPEQARAALNTAAHVLSALAGDAV